jgi:hypothetical protein
VAALQRWPPVIIRSGSKVAASISRTEVPTFSTREIYALRDNKVRAFVRLHNRPGRSGSARGPLKDIAEY